MAHSRRAASGRFLRLTCAAAMLVGLIGPTGCSSDQGGLPYIVFLHNRTAERITVVQRRDDGTEVTLVKEIAPNQNNSVNMTGFGLDLCTDGMQLALDPSGKKIARRDTDLCREWTIGASPDPSIATGVPSP